MLYLVTLQRYRMPEIHTDLQMARPVFRIKLHKNEKEEGTMNKKKFSTKFLVEMALLVAIILIMAFTPLGYIKTAGIEMDRLQLTGQIF